MEVYDGFEDLDVRDDADDMEEFVNFDDNCDEPTDQEQGY